MVEEALMDGTSREEIGLRYVHLFSEPRPLTELRSTIDELVAGDHITYQTSWGTLLGRNALKEYAETVQAAFPSISFRIDHVASCDDTLYCQWNIDETHWIQCKNSSALELSTDRKTMAVRFRNDLIIETWQPCDPWLPLGSGLHVTPPNRTK